MAFKDILESLKVACLVLLILLATRGLSLVRYIQEEQVRQTMHAMQHTVQMQLVLAHAAAYQMAGAQDPPWLLPTVHVDAGKEQCDGAQDAQGSAGE